MMLKMEDLYARLKHKLKNVSGRSWLSLVTFLLIIILIVTARHELVVAWKLLEKVNIFILLLLIPVQFASYYANAEIFFNYLRSRGQLKKTSHLEAAGMALELNFVNHIFPSGGVSGISYMVWRLGKLGVAPGQATMAQLMRYVVQLSSFAFLLVIALIAATFENRTSNWVVVMVSVFVTSMVFLVIFGSYLVGSEKRMNNFAHWFTRTVNLIVRKVTFGRKDKVLQLGKVETFFMEFHDDFMVLKRDKRLLIKPIIWSFIFNIVDVMLFVISFWALGIDVNLAVLLIAYGAAASAGFLMLTPGGAGAYEAIMVTVLSAGGMHPGAAVAGVVLTRATLMVGTLLTGFIVYHQALKKYGKPKLETVDFSPDDSTDEQDK